MGKALKRGQRKPNMTTSMYKRVTAEEQIWSLSFPSSLVLIKNRATTTNSNTTCRDSLLQLKDAVEGDAWFNYLTDFEEHYGEDPMEEILDSELQIKETQTTCIKASEWNAGL